MGPDARAQLAEELSDLFVVRLALILVPVRHTVKSIGRHELASVIGKVTRDLRVNLASTLSKYDVHEGIYDESEHV